MVELLFLTLLHALLFAFCSTILGIQIGSILTGQNDISPLRLSDFDTAILIIFLSIAPFVFRPRNFVPYIVFTLLVPFWVVTAQSWDLVQIGSAREFQRVLNGGVHGARESVAVTVTFLAILASMLSHFARSASQALSLAIYAPFWKKSYPLVAAAISGDAKLLDDRGWADMAYLQVDPAWGRTPLHWAASLHQTEGVEILLRRNPEAVSKTDLDGNTPLHLSAAVLFERIGKPLWTENKGGRTAIDVLLAGRQIQDLELAWKLCPDRITRDRLQQTVETMAWPEGREWIKARSRG